MSLSADARPVQRDPAFLRSSRRLLRYPLRQWRLLLVLVGTMVVSATTAALEPLAMKLLVDNALDRQRAPHSVVATLESVGLTASPRNLVYFTAVAMLALALLNGILTVVTTWAWTVAGQKMVFDLGGDLFSKLQRLSLAYHRRRHVGDTLSRMTDDTYAVYVLANTLFVGPVHQVLTVATVGFAAWKLDHSLALMVFAITPVVVGVARRAGARVKESSTADREARARLTSLTHQILTAIPLVQAYGTQRSNAVRFSHVSDEAVRAGLRAKLTSLVLNNAGSLVTTSGVALVLIVGTGRTLSGQLSVGALLAFMAYLRTLEGVAAGLVQTYGDVRAAGASVDRVVEVLESGEEVKTRPGARRPKTVSGHVRLDHVTFGYVPGVPVLHDICLEAAPGEVVALVGETGAGKSTLVSLIPRFFDPWEGSVTLDGVDLRDLNLGVLRDNVALLLQDPYLLPMTIEQNIVYGRPRATAAEILAASSMARAHEFISRLPNGYASLVGERGATLSGGERQRLAIARALVKDAPILILDEPTAALDARTEAALMEAIGHLVEHRTTFIVAHRLSTIQRADRVVVLADGRIVDQGTHRELLRRPGPYREIHAAASSTDPRRRKRAAV